MPTRVEHLQELLGRLDARMDAGEEPLAALSREKRQVLAELDALGQVEGGVIDDLAARRKRRRSKAATSSAAK